MRTTTQVKTTAPAILPLAMVLIPKCPLCLLPFFAAAGLTLPPRGWLDGFLVAVAAAWLGLLANATRSVATLALAVLGAALLLGGRWVDLPAAGWAGAVLILAAAIGAAARKRSCERSCRAAATNEA